MELKKILLGGAGAYGLYWLYQHGVFGGAAPAASPSSTPTNPTTQPVQNPTVQPPNTKALVLARAGNDPNELLTFDQWNFFYSQIRGIPGPDPNQFLDQAHRSQNLSIDEWWGDMTSAGFSGLGCAECPKTNCGGCAHSKRAGFSRRGTPRNPHVQIPRGVIG